MVSLQSRCSPAGRRCACLLLAVLAGPAQAAADSMAVPALSQEQGIARDPGSRQELYREQHLVRRDGPRLLERLVLYRCPDGTAFGRKLLDYRNSATAPSFVFDDVRSGYREGLRGGLAPALFYRPGRGSGERSAPLRAAGAVVDAGFDEFVRANWATLLSGKPVTMQFAVPSRLRTMAFSLARAASACIAGEEAWVFRLKLDGWLGLIAPSIDVSYGKQSRRLLRFEGLSNLRDAAGTRPLLARIDFPGPAAPAAEPDWQAALAAPLSACHHDRTP